MPFVRRWLKIPRALNSGSGLPIHSVEQDEPKKRPKPAPRRIGFDQKARERATVRRREIDDALAFPPFPVLAATV